MNAKKLKKKPAKRGQKAEVLKLEGGWQDNTRNAMAKPKPASGWPNR
jgi:hypothetical protein